SPPRRSSDLAPHCAAVDPCHIDIVDLPERERCALACLSRAQLDDGTQPHHAVECRKLRIAPLFPVAELARRGSPAALLLAGPRLRRRHPALPPALPYCAPASNRLCWPRVFERKDLEHLVEAARGTQRLRAHPRLDSRTAPRCVNQAHRHLDVLLQLPCKVEARSREVGERLARRRLPP